VGYDASVLNNVNVNKSKVFDNAKIANNRKVYCNISFFKKNEYKQKECCSSDDISFEQIMSETVSNISTFKIKFENSKKQLSKIRSKSDKDVNDIYHTIETKKFSACQGYLLAKSLQKALQERRKIKEVFCLFDSISNCLKENMHKLKKY